MTQDRWLSLRVGSSIGTHSLNSYEDTIVNDIIPAVGQRVQSLNDALILINSATNAQHLPDSIGFDFAELNQLGIQPADAVAVVRLTLKINCTKLGTYKNIRIGARVHRPVSQQHVDTLIAAGVDVVIPGSRAFGTQETLNALHKFHQHKDQCLSYLVDKTKKHKIVHTDSSVLDIGLTPQQSKIAYCIAKKGLTNKQMAKQFGLSESVVKMHIGLVLKKYGIKNRTQLALLLNNMY